MGLAQVVAGTRRTDYCYGIGANGELVVCTGGIDTSDRMVVRVIGDRIEGGGTYTACCGGALQERMIAAVRVSCRRAPRAL